MYYGEIMEERNKRTMTIRGIDKDLYDRAVALAKETGRTVGEVINEALRLILSLASTTASTAKELGVSTFELGKAAVEGMKEGLNIYEISDIEEIELTKDDLENIEGIVRLRNIKRLVFSNDITEELIDKKIHSIVMCDEIIIPRHIRKLKVLKKCKFIKKIRFTE